MLYFKRLIQIPRLPEVPAPSSGRRRGCSPPCPCDGMGLGGRVAGGSAEGGASWLLGRGAPSSFHPLPPQGPPNFLRASALAEHIKPVVVIPEEAPEDEEPENLIEISTGPPAGEPAVSGAPSLPPPSLPPSSLPPSPLPRSPGGAGRNSPSKHCCPWQVVADLFEQTFGPPNGSVKDDR